MKFDLPDMSKLVVHFLTELPTALAIIVGALAINFALGRLLTFLGHKTHLQPQDLVPVRRLVRSCITIGTCIFVLSAFGLSMSGLWTIFSTIFALVAIGFVAVWSILSNTLCTIVILIFRPFAIGDELEFPGEPIRGRVVDLNFIYTTLETDDKIFLQIPNNLFFQKVLKRRLGRMQISLSTQLNSRDRAELPAIHAGATADASSRAGP